MKLILTNPTTKKEIVLDGLEDTKTSLKYMNFNINLPSGVEDGDYTYELEDEGMTMSTGIVRIGDFKPENTTYNNEKKDEYITYDGAE